MNPNFIKLQILKRALEIFLSGADRYVCVLISAASDGVGYCYPEVMELREEVERRLDLDPGNGSTVETRRFGINWPHEETPELQFMFWRVRYQLLTDMIREYGGQA